MNSDTLVSTDMKYDAPIVEKEVEPKTPMLMSTSLTPQMPVIIGLDPTSFGLPNGWTVEQRYRTSSKYIKKSDKFFYELGTRKMFRSLKSAHKYLKEKAKNEALEGSG
ncbi:hypothetical protein PVL29_017266 [Vitis rotundifolia]|uniref:MBD domain-containing protein n=1 Tax=Vitis rotundifolia TaxID=103349 RepID=A0AA38ZA00_VITRO|nr:hypothetical protein PVL29_017266 [Vitis rotundifolia]